MPQPGKRWYHIILNTHRSWLPGDARGFRSRKHRLHSSGDYRSPPPRDEHQGLRKSIEASSGEAVQIPTELFERVGVALLRKIAEQDYRVNAVCVAATHAHLLVELPNDRAEAKRLAGSWKQASSHAVRDALPGKLWCRGSDPLVVSDEAHYQRVSQYIMRHASEGAWVWRYRNGWTWQHDATTRVNKDHPNAVPEQSEGADQAGA